jgi:hypothetical protein
MAFVLPITTPQFPHANKIHMCFFIFLSCVILLKAEFGDSPLLDKSVKQYNSPSSRFTTELFRVPGDMFWSATVSTKDYPNLAPVHFQPPHTSGTRTGLSLIAEIMGHASSPKILLHCF